MSNKISFYRKQKKWSQEDLADLLGTSSGMISMLETGKRRLNSDWTKKLSLLFGCDQSDLWDVPQDTRGEDFQRLMLALKNEFKDDAFMENYLNTLELAIEERRKD